MINRLFFYSITDFNEIRNYYNLQEKNIVSIREFINLKEYQYNLTYNFTQTVIDISYLGSMHDNLQYIGENIFSKLSNTSYEFICDEKYRSAVETELRFCFNYFEKFSALPQCINNNDENRDLINKHVKVTDLTENEFNDFISKFRDSLYGHDKFKDEFTNLLKSFRVFNALGEHKVLSLFLLGESGVGKTEVARSIYKSLGGKSTLAKVNFGNYSNEFSLSSLIGSARGYVGSEDGEIFIRVRNTDIGVILIDEFEKSNATLFNFFLDVVISKF